MSDRNATALLEQVALRGLGVKRDLSVVGSDNAPEAAISRPPLTTVAQPLVDKARRAADLLFDGAPPERVILPVRLITRGSTGCGRGTPTCLDPAPYREVQQVPIAEPAESSPDWNRAKRVVCLSPAI